MNVIKQIIIGDEPSTQTIKMIVRDNERGAQGEQGEKGDAATVTVGDTYTVSPDAPAAVMNSGTSSEAILDFYIPRGEKGEPGAIHYVAGTGIKITDGNVIEATGDATAAWGGIQGNINSQTDLQTEFGKYTKTSDLQTEFALYTKTADLPVNIGEVLSTPTDVAFVGTNNIQDEAVTTDKIDDGAVTTAKIADGAVTTTKITDAAVTTAKIDDGTVTSGKIDWTPVTTVVTNFETGFSAVSADAQKLRVRKFGKIVQLIGEFKVDTAFTEQYKVFCTLPSGCWPPNATATIIVGSSGDGYSFGNIRSDNGKVVFLGSKGTPHTIETGTYQISAFYMVS